MEDLKLLVRCKVCGCKFWKKYYELYASQGRNNTIKVDTKPIWICKACGNVLNFEQYMFDKIESK